MQCGRERYGRLRLELERTLGREAHDPKVTGSNPVPDLNLTLSDVHNYSSDLVR
jgi:hypothetical protein